ncbi:HNH endonuclease domain-containing protein [Chryseobacterium gotjawalense]|uniref:CRISPR-associated endonuclease Cas9 n=1 Tax=Chryseobacterium gotjawalense TaxID=3042315 RepID=A0ABY8RC28_9FLAO|nr:type II CRISPR RNA-guided endonuclease Cas9 [Chryseobacterium sp. wdc7]WHF51527.1 HNH endonuclease domain-containing protein [Chryseobacterium sp. wdc7]
MKKNILGLDLGTNSIGWALVQQDFENKTGNILGMGARIIPMTQDVMDNFGGGKPTSTQTAERTGYRGVRRLRERFLLRRERLHRVLNILDFLPEHYAAQIDFEKRFGKFKNDSEPKLVYYKNDFIFKKSFEEMLTDFKNHQPQLLENNTKVPYDWTMYYLRKKALSQKIEKEELAWLLLNFNQKRGYYQLRGEEEEENPNKLIEFYSLKIIDVTADEPQKGKSDIWYSLQLENGWVYRRSSKTPLFEWKNKIRDFIVTTDLNDDGSIKTDKDGNEKRSFRAPSENDWTLVKKKTEQEIYNSHKTVGTYIYEALLQNPKQKIKGKLVRTIERKFYKEELKQILIKQKEFHSEFQNDDLYLDCTRDLYKNNDAHQLVLSKKDFVHLFLDDLIFYQRPLRSQKSSISNCTLEFRKHKDENGVEQTRYLKVISKSNPYYQEFRIWQWMYNLSIYKKDDEGNPITIEFLNSNEDYENLFEFLNTRKEIDQKALLKYFKLNEKTHRWNYVEDKKYPCNETKTLITSRLEKVESISEGFLTKEIEQKLWHLIYSVNDKIEYEKALKSFAQKNNLHEISFFEAFRKFPPFKSEYGAFSEKAIKKLLPLMRLGKYWDANESTKNASTYKENIDELLGNLNRKDTEISKNDRDKWKKTINIKLRDELEMFLDGEVESFQGLRLHIAQYLVYGRHSEASITGKCNSADELEEFLKEFKQHSLRNPIVEQVITETLRVVKDIWAKYGNGAKDFFSEIHIELGREMKNTAEDRLKITNLVTTNENTNLRIKALLAEMMNDGEVENVRPYSPMQQEILKIYEDGILNSDIEIEDDILKISKTAQPAPSDLKRYKLWLEQRYKSPYTGQVIPLNKLFTTEYEIEHIIPQSRYFDDSFSNKVICESAVNKLKDNYIGLGFIKQFHGQIVECGFGKNVKIFEVEEYEDFVKKHYDKNRGKRTKLLMEDIPEKFIERQLNDTRYISKYISGVLSNIVRGENNDDEVNSINIVPGNGKITTQLKQDWGLNDVWNELILPRFERMNQLTNSTDFTAWNENHQKFLPTVPIELSKGFSKKRIDHRHHAIDALVIACATKEHVNFMNNEHALRKGKTKDEKQNIRYDLRKNLCYKKYNGESKENYKWIFNKPWDDFTIDTKHHLETITVSFKQNLRVINKATNYYEKYVEKENVKAKERVEQTGTNWAIRKSMHKETVSGKVDLPWVKVPKGKILTATRKNLDASFDLKSINSITDTGIQKILTNYLVYKENNPELAFSPEGIEDMNKNIEKFNDGKPHQPIYKVRVFEMGSKFSLGQTGNKKDKYVEAAKGTNLFFAVYQDKNGKRSYTTIPLNEVIERQKQGLSSVLATNEKGDSLLFNLSPNDLVYIPTEDEIENVINIDFQNISKEKSKNIYKTVSFSGSQIFFVKQDVASSIVNKAEFSTLNKMERAIDGTMIKDNCIKLNIDRLGNISKA